ncbi:hypothetical protein V6Z12_A02G193700 [Gossypium hirsutum]
MREELQPPCPWPHKMMRSTNSDNETETKCNEKSEFLTQQIRHNGCPARNDDKSTSHPIIQQFKTHEMTTEKPCYQIVMHPSYVGHSSDKKCRLKLAKFSISQAIPANFVRKHLMEKQCSVLLRNSRGKTWIATFKRRRIGEGYIYEAVINSIEISSKVVIHQGQHANCQQSLASTNAFCPDGKLRSTQKTKAFRIASALKSENPFFVVIIQPSHSIPVIHLLSNGKSWPVIYFQHSIKKSNVIFVTGWRGFAMDNNLEVGDVCAFELIEGPKTSMKLGFCSLKTDDRSREKQVEPHESLKKGDISNLLVDYNCDASRENLR